MPSPDLVNIFTGTYRGVVKDNYDPEIKGRCKIWIPSIYPITFEKISSALPWSEPIMSVFGGSYANTRVGDLNTEVGICSIPHIGAEVWVFFENGDHNYPKYFGVCQSGTGWLSEHNNQHVIKTDNVRIRIDENPSLSGSTSKFTTYNDKCTIDSIEQHTKLEQPTRVDIEILMKEGCGLNLKIVGDVNMFISGDVYEDIRGNKHETLSGDLFRHHVGNIHYVHKGDVLHEHTGDRTYIQTGDENETQLSGNKNHFQLGEKKRKQIGNNTDVQVQGARTFTQLNSITEPTPIYVEALVGGTMTEYILNNSTEVVLGSCIKLVGITTSEVAGAQASRLAPVIIDYPAVTTRAATTIIDQAKSIDHRKG